MDSYPFTFDFADDEPNYCLDLDICTSNPCDYSHVCADDDLYDGFMTVSCGAECDQDEDCPDYCLSDILYYDGVCDYFGNYSCECFWQSTEDCDHYDGWYNTSTTRWINLNECTVKEQINQEYRNYSCTPENCDYNTTGETRWIDTGEIAYKAAGTECGDYSLCPEDACNDFFAEFYPDGEGHDYCDGFGECIDYCAIEDSYCSDNNATDGVNGLTCGADCDQNEDCESGVCLENCTCEAVACPWDVTGDDYVGIDDIVAVAEHFGESPGHPDWDPVYDVNDDDYVGIDDIVETAEHFGESC
jgi:hypothetical protein